MAEADARFYLDRAEIRLSMVNDGRAYQQVDMQYVIANALTGLLALELERRDAQVTHE